MSEQVVSPSPWRTMESAPKDGTEVLAFVGGANDRWEHLNGRTFVIRHGGDGYRGYDRGWSAFPGLAGAPDNWFVRWTPIPPSDGGAGVPVHTLSEPSNGLDDKAFSSDVEGLVERLRVAGLNAALLVNQEAKRHGALGLVRAEDTLEHKAASALSSLQERNRELEALMGEKDLFLAENDAAFKDLDLQLETHREEIVALCEATAPFAEASPTIRGADSSRPGAFFPNVTYEQWRVLRRASQALSPDGGGQGKQELSSARDHALTASGDEVANHEAPAIDGQGGEG